jgi:hypothetical protein
MANRTPETMSTSYQHEDIDGMGLAKDHKLQQEIDQQNRDSAINRAMAEVAGWHPHPDNDSRAEKAWTFGGGQYGATSILATYPTYEDRSGETTSELPNFLLDLNAVHKVVRNLRDGDYADYSKHLLRMFGFTRPRYHDADAHQRCEAILRTLNKWNPEWDH